VTDGSIFQVGIGNVQLSARADVNGVALSITGSSIFLALDIVQFDDAVRHIPRENTGLATIDPECPWQ
jgi:hypothetical protein